MAGQLELAVASGMKGLSVPPVPHGEARPSCSCVGLSWGGERDLAGGVEVRLGVELRFNYEGPGGPVRVVRASWLERDEKLWLARWAAYGNLCSRVQESVRKYLAQFRISFGGVGVPADTPPCPGFSPSSDAPSAPPPFPTFGAGALSSSDAGASSSAGGPGEGDLYVEDSGVGVSPEVASGPGVDPEVE